MLSVLVVRMFEPKRLGQPLRIEKDQQQSRASLSCACERATSVPRDEGGKEQRAKSKEQKGKGQRAKGKEHGNVHHRGNNPRTCRFDF
jgi:hypothetical protein